MTESLPPVFTPCTHYFEPVAREQLREKLAHMVRFSDFVLALTGEKGVGKSQFAIQLANSLLHPEHQVCLLSGERCHDEVTLVEALFTQLPDQLIPSTFSSPIEALSEVIALLRNQGIRLLLILDSAEKVSDPAVALLTELQLIHNHSDGLCPQVFFVGDVSFAEKLSRLSEEEGFAQRYFQVELGPLSQDEVKQYLAMRFGERGQVKPKTLAKLYKKTQGNFAQLEAHFTKQTHQSSAKAFPFPMFHMVALACSLVLVLAVSVWYFVPEDDLLADTQAQQSDLALPINSLETASSSEVRDRVVQQTLSERFAASEQALVELKSAEDIVSDDLGEPLEQATVDAEKAAESDMGFNDDIEPIAVVNTPTVNVPELAVTSVPVLVPTPAEPTNAVADASVAPAPIDQTETQPGTAVTEIVLEKGAEEVPVAVPDIVLEKAAEEGPVAVTDIGRQKAEEEEPEVVTPSTPVTNDVVPEQLSHNGDAATAPKSNKNEQVAKVSDTGDATEKATETEPSEPVASSVVAKPSGTEKAVVATSPAPDQITQRLRADEARLLQLEPQGYVLQLLGARNIASIKTFVERWGTMDDLYVFETVYKGKTFFVVIYGQYTSRDSAKTGISELPSSIQALRPWARSLRGVQEDVQKR
ncbi:MAG: SPOR domain-containing protein [Pontibacterium sp.]